MRFLTNLTISVEIDHGPLTLESCNELCVLADRLGVLVSALKGDVRLTVGPGANAECLKHEYDSVMQSDGPVCIQSVVTQSMVSKPIQGASR